MEVWPDLHRVGISGFTNLGIAAEFSTAFEHSRLRSASRPGAGRNTAGSAEPGSRRSCGNCPTPKTKCALGRTCRWTDSNLNTRQASKAFLQKHNTDINWTEYFLLQDRDPLCRSRAAVCAASAPSLDLAHTLRRPSSTGTNAEIKSTFFNFRKDTGSRWERSLTVPKPAQSHCHLCKTNK